MQEGIDGGAILEVGASRKQSIKSWSERDASPHWRRAIHSIIHKGVRTEHRGRVKKSDQERREEAKSKSPALPHKRHHAHTQQRQCAAVVVSGDHAGDVVVWSETEKTLEEKARTQ